MTETEISFNAKELELLILDWFQGVVEENISENGPFTVTFELGNRDPRRYVKDFVDGIFESSNLIADEI